MEKKIFNKNKFSAPALELFKMAQNIAAQLGSAETSCRHFLAAALRLCPEVVADLLKKDLSDWLNTRNLDWALLDVSNAKVPLADELSILFFDDSEDTPLHFIKNIFPNRILGPAEAVFIVLKEPTEEISEILSSADVINDLLSYEERLCDSYLECCDTHAGISPRERLKQCADMGRRFQEFMNTRVIGQQKAVESIASALSNFRFKGNNRKPLTVLLISRSGGGASFFAQTLQEAFVELGFQKNITPVTDLSCFLHREAADAELLGEDKSYKSAHPGQLYLLANAARHGAIVFENIQNGCDNARRILLSLTQNTAYDKYFQKNLKLPHNVLVCTLTLPEYQYDFLLKNGKDPDGKTLLDVYNKSRTAEDQNDLSLVTAMQEIIVLEELDQNKLEEIAANKLASAALELDEEYGVSLDFSSQQDIVSLLMQSTPGKLTPKELTEITEKTFGGLRNTVVKHPDIRRISVVSDPLPVYQHDPARRTTRGDYLTFKKEESYENGIQTIAFRNLQYTTQESIDCGTYRIERPKNISLKDIVGLDHVIAEFKEAMDYITGKFDPELPPPASSFLLVGPPGCGKTCTMTAIANACDIPVFFATSSAYASAQAINDLFYKAKTMAPCILLLDEINSIGSAAQYWRVDAVNALLSQLDGFEKLPPMLLVASTNYVSQLEPALLRYGRLSRIVHIGYPTGEAREKYIRSFEQKYAFELSAAARAYLVGVTEGRNVVDLKATLEHALRTSAKNGTTPDMQQLEDSFLHISEGAGQTTAAIGFSGVNAR